MRIGSILALTMSLRDNFTNQLTTVRPMMTMTAAKKIFSKMSPMTLPVPVSMLSPHLNRFDYILNQSGALID